MQESAESKARGTGTADAKEKTDVEGSGRGDKDNGWVWQTDPPRTVTENEVLNQSMSLLYTRPNHQYSSQ